MLRLATLLTDISDLGRAVAWPLAAVVIVVLARNQLSELAKGLIGSLSKVSVVGVAFEFARVSPVGGVATNVLTALSQSVVAGEIQAAAAGNLTQSATNSLKSLIQAGERTDYAVIDLGDGRRWLSSRLYLAGAMLRWTLGVQEFVFLETAGTTRNRFVGKATTAALSLALGTKYPHLDDAFSQALQITPVERIYRYPGSEEKRLPGEPSFTQAADLIETFVGIVQKDPQTDSSEWMRIRKDPDPVFEHARWIDGEGIERLLRHNLDRDRIVTGLDKGSESVGRQAALARGSYVATVDSDGRFDTLLDRCKINEEIARRALS